MRKVVAAFAAVALATSINPVLAQENAVNGDVVYFQDMKEFEPRVWKDGSEHGGMARLATVLESIQNQEDGALIAVGGDVASGTLFNSVYRGKPFVDAFNALGVDVANFGNHDFDFGADYALELVEKATFPWISTNLTTPDGKPFSPDGTTSLLDQGDLKVGFIALTHELQRTPASRDVIVQDFILSARAGVSQLQNQGADVIILLSQIDRELTHEVMEAVPAINAALREENEAQSPAEHSQTTDGRWVLAPEADYGTVEHLDITKNRTTGKVTVVPTSIKVDPSIAEHAEWKQRSKTYYEELDRDLAAQVGVASQDLSKADLGYLVADGYRQYFDTEIGLQNGGGQRAEIEKGPITLRSLKSVLPFGNSVTAVKATGAQVRQVLEQGIESNPTGGGGFPRTAGLRFDFDPDAPFGERITDIELESGKPFDDDAEYTVAVSRFIADGGDGMTGFLEAERITSEIPIDVDVFEKYVRAQQELRPYVFSASQGGNQERGSSTASAVLISLAAIVGIGSLVAWLFSDQIHAFFGRITHP